MSLIPRVRPIFIVATGLLAVASGTWHARGDQRFIFDRHLVQASRSLASLGWVGMAYFGWILGASLLTEMTTPVVAVLAALGTVAGVKFGLAAGLGLGLARSVEPWRGVYGVNRDPATIMSRYAAPRRGAAFKLTGIALSFVVLAVDVALAARWVWK